MAIEQEMIDIIVEQLSVEKDKVVANASFVDDLSADSLDLVELIMAMEEGYYYPAIWLENEKQSGLNVQMFLLKGIKLTTVGRALLPQYRQRCQHPSSIRQFRQIMIIRGSSSLHILNSTSIKYINF